VVTNNPFIFETPVRSRERFYDRETITQRIVDRLRLMQDSSVIGEQRMGKTSLLHHLTEPTVLRKYGLDPSRYAFVYVSFQDAPHLTPDLFWDRVLSVVSQSLTDAEVRASIQRACDARDFDPSNVERLFRRIARKGIRIALLLDEFESVTRAVRLDADFFTHLRSLATLQVLGLIFVTSSRRKLSELSHAGIVGSPFFNIFETFVLSPFDTGEAETMLQSSLAGTNVVFSPAEVDFLTLLSGRHPCLLQMAASFLFDAYVVRQWMDSQALEARLEYVEREFNTRAEVHLRHYWQQSSDPERVVLMALSMLRRTAGRGASIDLGQLKKLYPDVEVAARELIERGLLIVEQNRYRALSPSFERWVAREITESGSRGDYVSWLDANVEARAGSLDSIRESAADIAPVVNSTYWSLITQWARTSDNPERVVRLIAGCASGPDPYPIWREYARVSA
jgi:hypothetical protein